eukprot:4999498-Pleurochrysis_carterae.AAC.1
MKFAAPRQYFSRCGAAQAQAQTVAITEGFDVSLPRLTSRAHLILTCTKSPFRIWSQGARRQARGQHKSWYSPFNHKEVSTETSHAQGLRIQVVARCGRSKLALGMEMRAHTLLHQRT